MENNIKYINCEHCVHNKNEKNETWECEYFADIYEQGYYAGYKAALEEAIKRLRRV